MDIGTAYPSFLMTYKLSINEEKTIAKNCLEELHFMYDV